MTGEVPFLPGAAEAVFGVDAVSGDRTATTGTMDTGPWSAGPDGRSRPGALGVLIDDVLGYAVVSARPAGHWAVSTEIHADFSVDQPPPGVRLSAEGAAVDLGPTGGLASGVVRDPWGRVVATATERLQYVLGEPLGLSEDVAVSTTPAVVRREDFGSVVQVLGARSAARELRFAPSERLANPVGNLHGGVLFCAVELAGQSALADGPTPLVTSSVHLAFLRPLRLHAPVRVEATVPHRGRTLGVAHVVVSDPAGKVCALATVTGRGAG
jgi:uncharacterized protein (TIGR00369 family)